MANQFSSFPLSTELQSVLEELGFSELTAIQKESLPLLLEGRDLIGQSQTGSGKTAAFSIPILQKINLAIRMPQALILCPTRELGAQVTTEIRKLGRRYSGLQVLLLSGGQDLRTQLSQLEQGVHILVGTPGRVLDVFNRERMDPTALSTIVLDEADKMLEMGFEKEINSIFQFLSNDRQTVLFSATFPVSIEKLSRQYQKKPVKIQIEDKETTALIRHLVYEAPAEDKAAVLMRILQEHEAESSIIFCNQKATVAELSAQFQSAGVSSGELHGDLEQRDRDLMMTLFRNKSIRILVATDVAARGIDIENLELVVNFDFPAQVDVYTHRVGRTGRAGKQGLAITLIQTWDAIKLIEIGKSLGVTFERPSLGFKNQHGLSRSSIYCNPEMRTFSISGGRKEKLRPGDILGALTNPQVGIQSADIGKIEVKDQITYFALSSRLPEKSIQKMKDLKIKGRKFQIKPVLP